MASGGASGDLYENPGLSGRRLQEIKVLPSEHISFFTSPDRFLIQNSSQVSVGGGHGLPIIKFRDQETTNVQLILIGKNVIESGRLGWFHNPWRALAYIAGVIFPVDQIEVPDLGPSQGVYEFFSTTN